MIEVWGIQCSDGRVFGLPEPGGDGRRACVPPLFAREDQAQAWLRARSFLPAFDGARAVALTVLVGVRLDALALSACPVG